MTESVSERATGPVAPQPPLISNYVLVLAVYILYLVGFLTVFLSATFVIGVIIAYRQRGKTDSVCESHIEFQIRTFWMVILLSLLLALAFGIGQLGGGVAALAVIGLLIAVLWVFLLLIRCVKGLLALNAREPIHNPKSWWLGDRSKPEWPP